MEKSSHKCFKEPFRRRAPREATRHAHILTSQRSDTSRTHTYIPEKRHVTHTYLHTETHRQQDVHCICMRTLMYINACICITVQKCAGVQCSGCMHTHDAPNILSRLPGGLGEPPAETSVRRPIHVFQIYLLGAGNHTCPASTSVSMSAFRSIMLQAASLLCVP
jgi:hypothetical protein